MSDDFDQLEAHLESLLEEPDGDTPKKPDLGELVTYLRSDELDARPVPFIIRHYVADLIDVFAANPQPMAHSRVSRITSGERAERDAALDLIRARYDKLQAESAANRAEGLKGLDPLRAAIEEVAEETGQPEWKLHEWWNKSRLEEKG
jgi:hypothetical protein